MFSMYNYPSFHQPYYPAQGYRPYPHQPSMIPLQYFPSQIDFMFYRGYLKDLPTLNTGEIPPDVVMSVASPRSTIGQRSLVVSQPEHPMIVSGSYVL